MRRSLLSAVLSLAIPLHVAFAATSTSTQGSPQTSSQPSLRGRVLDPSRAPIAGAHVTVMSGRAGEPIAVETNQQGEFEVAVAPGAYTVRVNAANFVEAAQDVTVTAGGER